MKMYKKKDCKYKDGYIVCGGKVLSIDNKIVDLLNELEDWIQRSCYDDVKQKICDFCSVKRKEFHRVSEHGKIYPTIIPNTPDLDKAVEQTMAIMEDLDAIAAAEKMNDLVKRLAPVFEFAASKTIVSGDQAVQHRFDLPTIGNPLKLTPQDIADHVTGLF